MRKYQQSAAFKLAQKKYQKSEKGKLKLKQLQKKYQKSEKGKNVHREAQQRYRKKNLDYYKKYIEEHYEYLRRYRTSPKIKAQRQVYKKKLRKQNPSYKLKEYMITQIYNAITKYKGVKKSRTVDYIGLSIPEFKKYLENKFEEGMNWDNYGEWHVDHIKPISWHKISNEEELKKCFHYTNLQPLWGKANVKKGNRWEG